MSLGLILLLAFSAQIVLAASWMLAAETAAQKRRVSDRLTRTVAAPAVALAVPTIARAAAATSAGPIKLANLFGFEWNRRDLYPVRWWIVVTGTFAAGWLWFILLRGLFGNLAVLDWPIGWVLVSRMLFKGWDRSRRDQLLAQFADALGMIVRTFSVGVPLVEAVKLVAREAPEPTSTEFRQLADEVAIGRSLDEAVLAMAERTGMTEYRFFATTVLLQTQTGGGLGEALTNLADVVRKRIVVKARGFALSSEARTSAKVLMGLPVAAGLGMFFMSPGYMDPLLYTETGHKLIGLAILSLIVGALAMRSIIRSALA